MITVHGLRFSYGSHYVLNDVNFEVKRGELVFILGPNGAGKSTLLKCMAGILKYEGSVRIQGRELKDISKEEISRIIGYIPQSVKVAPITVFETVLTGRKPYFSWRPSSKDISAVWRVLESLGIRHLSFRSLYELSGGELQLAMIARALAQEPKVLLLDEPTSNLDLKNQALVLKKIKEIIVKGIVLAAVISTHDVNLAASYADRILLLKDGHVHLFGSPKEVLREDVISDVYEIKVKTHYIDNKMLISVD